MKSNKTALALAMAAAMPLQAHAEEATNLPVVVVRDEAIGNQNASVLTHSELQAKRAANSDTASLLLDVPGVSLYTNGGVSGLPAVHGLADDRLHITVDGAETVASCPNHMNPALSYIAPTNVGKVTVYAGIAPVSAGGDSIGGAIVVESPAPLFAAPGAEKLVQAEAGTFYRSNGNARGGNASATFATESFSMKYSGSVSRSDDYKAGGDFKNLSATGNPGQTLPLNAVGSTAYNVRNQELALAWKNDRDLYEARFGHQSIPYELYPNQRMDMLANTADRFNLRYLSQRNWGALEIRAYQENVDHYMDFGPDKKLNYGSIVGTSGTVWQVDGMPMYTKGKTGGADIKADVQINPRDLLRIGADIQNYRLDDWWTPAPNCGFGECTGGMAPNTFWNINGGQRDRKSLFGEWEARWNPQWLSLLGLRAERITMNTGSVQGYNTGMMYASSSVGTTAQFNALNLRRSDRNDDLTALIRNTPDANKTYEFGYAQKTRSPNLYERYTWSANAMAMEMNNFVGDGNGYLGNPDLKPEVAHTLSLSGDWHDANREMEFKLNPYYTRISNYIDAVRTSGSVSMYVNGVLTSVPNATLTNGFVKLQYANQSARLYGIDVSGKLPLGRTRYGDWGLKGLLNYTKASNLDTGSGLYNIMPLNARLALTQKLGDWDNSLEILGVHAKDEVSAVRNEMTTPGYALTNLRTSYSWQKIRIDFGVENLFDRLYYLPLGGAYTGQGATMSLDREGGTIGTSGGTATLWNTRVAGPGRSVYAGVNLKF